MSQPMRSGLYSILLGDELGQIKLIQLDYSGAQSHNFSSKYHQNVPILSESKEEEDNLSQSSNGNNEDEHGIHYSNNGSPRKFNLNYKYATTISENARRRTQQRRHRIVRILDDCLQQEPAASRAITNIRPIESIYESHLDTTDKPNNLFLIANKVGQLFVCDTDAIRKKLRFCTSSEVKLSKSFEGEKVDVFNYDEENDGEDYHQDGSPMLSPIYYNMNSKVPVCGGQPINQTNILVVYQNGDIQHVNIGQDILQSSLKIKRKAIRMLGLGYNSDARAVHWKIDGSSGICYFDSDASSAHMDEKDPLTDIVLSSPTHKLSKNRSDRSQQNLYHKSPCIQSRKCNEQDRLVPTQVINMITSRTEQYKPSTRICKWSSITSLNLIYKKLALYDLVGSENFERSQNLSKFCVNSFKLNDNRLAVGGQHYALRVYDVQTQKAIFNCKTGPRNNPSICSYKGEPFMIGDIDWLGGNKTTKRCPQMLASCSGIDSIVKVYDLRSSRPVFNIDLSHHTENNWQPYENQSRGCMFTRLCASGAPYSTAVPSQQLVLGSTNGQLHIIDLRFVAKSHRTLGKVSGFCGGSVREIRFVSESFETSKMISCATDRFVRIHRIQTSFTSVISQKLSTKVFLGTKPTSIQPVCDEITQSYLSSINSRCGSESHISTIGSGGWSLL